ncbi:MAG: mechanosensitive ion channel family protein, partial [Deltaproteobacteria bacterium]|nr:mechanosensitive ion channel family protein [Deltaproteobacteria bacterium]
EKVNVHFVGFGESALELQVIYYIEDSSRILDGQHGVNRRIKESFAKEGIQMAYKTVTVKQS